MKIRIRYALKYDDGRYLSTDPNHFPLSSDEWDARRFYNTDDIPAFMRESPYRPDLWGLDPKRFEIATIELTIREVEPSGQVGDSKETPSAVSSGGD
jgi:hypothetical protein